MSLLNGDLKSRNYLTNKRLQNRRCGSNDSRIFSITWFIFIRTYLFIKDGVYVNPDEIERLTLTEERSKRNEDRINQLERNQQAMNEMVISVKYIAQSLTKVENKLDGLSGKVTALEMKPAKRWEEIVSKIIIAVVLAIVGFFLGKWGF